ncbi:roadblock/LC7 domain-containing protein [Plasticicumulans lactativorans]|uniref:Roadblock/LC7 domain-containing protein n=1 Tax=Plasticicumulans lactativorans TaxID=1133106 RepID=A0A4R2LAB0_9GAMM|nr:DUF2173 family protein [Plasticicumulans lactativorans]TCO83768.1 roadblock/LC7 domain-containing protein [Plasticicumulans lactativorans]
MSIVAELLAKPGVLAAGEYAFRGDRFSYKGQMSEEHARMASIMCRATTMGVCMQGRMAEITRSGTGLHKPRGWLLHGADYSICVVANVFCFMRNDKGTVNAVVKHMRQALADVNMDLV